MQIQFSNVSPLNAATKVARTSVQFAGDDQDEKRNAAANAPKKDEKKVVKSAAAGAGAAVATKVVIDATIGAVASSIPILGPLALGPLVGLAALPVAGFVGWKAGKRFHKFLKERENANNK